MSDESKRHLHDFIEGSQFFFADLKLDLDSKHQKIVSSAYDLIDAGCLDIDSVRSWKQQSDQTAPAQLFKLGAITSSKFWFRLARYVYYQIIARDRLRAHVSNAV